MGNGGSNAGNIHVYTEQPSYTAGETVRGNVYVFIREEVDSQGVKLTVRGSERVFWTERRARDRRDDTSDEPHYVDRSDEVNFFNVTMPLMMPGRIAPGQYQIPFHFNLPNNLPGTFVQENGSVDDSDYKCAVEYDICAYVDVPGVFSWNIKSVQQLTVKAVTDLSQTKAATVTKEGKVCMLCCIPRGKVWMKAYTEKDSYFPGDTALVKVEVQNDSGLAIEPLKIRLVRTLRLRTRGGGWGIYKADVLYSTNHPGVPPGEKLTASNPRVASLLLQDLNTGHPLKAETQGSLVVCTYTLEVPIHVYQPLTQPLAGIEYTQPQALPEAQAITWSPQMMEPIAIEVPTPSAPPMDSKAKIY